MAKLAQQIADSPIPLISRNGIAGEFLTSSEIVVQRRHPSTGQTAAAIIIALALHLGIGVHAKADDPHFGIIEYEISCMPCHGIDGHGDGPRAKSLKTVPADLTQIATHNKGEFPSKSVAEIVDGRASFAAHGQREMPVWGNRYRASAETNDTNAWIDQRVHAQIAALVRYIETIQKK